jgi:hypothetical protein
MKIFLSLGVVGSDRTVGGAATAVADTKPRKVVTTERYAMSAVRVLKVR